MNIEEIAKFKGCFVRITWTDAFLTYSQKKELAGKTPKENSIMIHEGVLENIIKIHNVDYVKLNCGKDRKVMISNKQYVKLSGYIYVFVPVALIIKIELLEGEGTLMSIIPKQAKKKNVFTIFPKFKVS